MSPTTGVYNVERISSNNSESLRHSMFERPAERVQKEVGGFRCRERSHQTDAEDLSGERTEASQHLDTVLRHQMLADLHIVNTGGHANGIQVPHAIRFGDMHRQPHPLE